MRGRLVLVAGLVLALAGTTVALALALAGGQGRSPSRNQAATPAHRRAHGTRRRPLVIALDTPPPSESRCHKAPPAVPERPIRRRTWLRGVTITEYYPAPERWFVGRRIHATGLIGTYAADWLYSARGLAMEGSGVDRHGRLVQIGALGSTGWVNPAGHNTVPVCLGRWSNGFPVWLIGGWRTGHGRVTFPLASGGWAAGRGGRRLPYGGVTFGAGSAEHLRYYHSIAVDPRLIPLDSRVYVPAYRHHGGGWFVAQDTGGAITGRHIDVYRPPPPGPNDQVRYLTRQRILVIPPT